MQSLFGSNVDLMNWIVDVNTQNMSYTSLFLCDFYQWQLSLSAITEGLHLTVKCKKTRLAAGLRPDPLGELTELPQTS